VRPPVVPLLAWLATGIASAICSYANRQQNLRRRAGGVQGPQHHPRLGRTHERGVLPFHGSIPVARSSYSYENSFITQESYGYAVVSRKILSQPRLPPALHHKGRFPYESGWRMASHVGTCMHILCFHAHRMSNMIPLRAGLRYPSTAWAARQSHDTARPSPDAPCSACGRRRVCRGAAPAVLGLLSLSTSSPWW